MTREQAKKSFVSIYEIHKWILENNHTFPNCCREELGNLIEYLKTKVIPLDIEFEE